MNRIYLFFITILFLSCNETKPPKKIEKKIEIYLNDLQSKYPNFDSNSAIRQELNDFLKIDFKKKFNDSILSDLPFKLDRVEKCENGLYILNLEHSLTSKLEKEGILSSLEIDLYCSIDENKAKKLIEGDFYYINGKFKEYLTFQNNEKYCANVLMSPYIGFDSEISNGEIQFGSIGFELKNIKKVE